MRKSLLILLLLSVTNSFSQDVYKTLLEGTYWGQPFELRQVTLSSEDGCNQFSHSQVLWYFKNENEPEKMDIGILTFNQLEDWKTFILMISGVADLKEVGYSKTNIVYKNFVAFINETQPLFISIITNPENKLALIRKNFFGFYYSYGLALLLGLHTFINVGVACGLLPTTGLTLPLISYGGTNLLFVCLMIGLVLRVDYENKNSMPIATIKRRAEF